MRAQRFGARVAADPRGHAVIAVPFDPDEAWGAKARHHVNGTVNGCRVRVTIAPGDSGWAFTLNPARMRDTGIAVGSDVIVELVPEGPQRGDLAADISAALAASPAAAAFFDTLAQFYRKAYLRYIDATTRRPDLRAARIVEVVDLLADGIKERPRSRTRQPVTRMDGAESISGPRLPTPESGSATIVVRLDGNNARHRIWTPTALIPTEQVRDNNGGDARVVDVEAGSLIVTASRGAAARGSP